MVCLYHTCIQRNYASNYSGSHKCKWVKCDIALYILSPIHYPTRDLQRRLHASQLPQTYLTSGCYVCSYELLLNSHKIIIICVPFIGWSDLAMNVADMIYVTLDHCQIRFTPQPNKKTCDCDPVLEILSYVFTESCNIDNGTILHPTKSWIHTESMLFTAVCKPIAFPSSVHLITAFFTHCILTCLCWTYSASPTDQVRHVGNVKAVSVLFYSSKCKHCSNKSLFIIAPLAIASIVLVMAIFIST